MKQKKSTSKTRTSARGAVTDAGRRGPSTKRARYPSLTTEQRAEVLVAVTEPLLDLFSVLDAVFTEDDALTVHKQVSLGRCYEAWKRARKLLDPDFDPDDRPRKTIGQRRSERLREALGD